MPGETRSAGDPGTGLDCGPAGRATGQLQRSPAPLTSPRAPLGAPRRLSRPPGSAATGCGDRPALRPRAPPAPHYPGDTHGLQEAQGAHVVPLGAQDLVEDAQTEAQLALRLPGGRARTGARRRGAGGPGVRVGTVLSSGAAAIAASGYLHSNAAAWCRLLPPRGGRAERRLRDPSTPSRTGRAGSAAGRALCEAGGTGGGGPGLGAEAARGGWTGGGRRRLRGSQTAAPPPARPGSVCQVPRRAEPQGRAAALGGDFGSSARPDRGRPRRSGGRNSPEGARRSSEASARTLHPNAWRPHPRRGLRHSHPTHATPCAHRHTHAGPAATALLGRVNTRLEKLLAESSGARPP